jgi:hypothetical protein
MQMSKFIELVYLDSDGKGSPILVAVDQIHTVQKSLENKTGCYVSLYGRAFNVAEGYARVVSMLGNAQ